MKRLFATAIGAFALAMMIVSPAHAIRIGLAAIALGEVQVIGDQAASNADITWEGNIVTQSNRRGAFQFSTTDQPSDCVGELGDGASTISVVIFGCTTQQVI